MGRKGQRRGSYADVLGQSDHPLVGFDPWGGLVQQAGRRLALGQRPQVCEVCGLTTELPGACGHSRAGQGAGDGGAWAQWAEGTGPPPPWLHRLLPGLAVAGDDTRLPPAGLRAGAGQGGALPGCLCRTSPSRWLLSSSSRCLGSPLSWVRLGESTGVTGSTPSGL